MSNKYIIKNCPCFNEGNPMLDYYGECLSLTDDTQVCQDCTDCVMKRIVELCKDKMDTEFNSGSIFAEEILNLLQIEEVE